MERFGIACKMMPKAISWNKNDVCHCKIASPKDECFSDDESFYILVPGPLFEGVGTAIVHAKCGKPVWPDLAFMRGVYFPSKWQFFGR